MGLDDSARKLRRAAARQIDANRPQRGGQAEEQRGKADAEAVEVHVELTRPEHSKGRPKPDERLRAYRDKKHPPSNAGNDGP